MRSFFSFFFSISSGEKKDNMMRSSLAEHLLKPPNSSGSNNLLCQNHNNWTLENPTHWTWDNRDAAIKFSCVQAVCPVERSPQISSMGPKFLASNTSSSHMCDYKHASPLSHSAILFVQERPTHWGAVRRQRNQDARASWTCVFSA